MRHLLNQSLKEVKPVEIIYQSKDLSFSKRRILVKAINEKYVKGFCFKKRQIRTFNLDSILAVAPIKDKREELFYA